MTRQRALQITFVGIAVAVVSYILSDTLAYAPYRLPFFQEGWVTAAGALIAIFGLYKVLSGNSN
jgi:hypothetical protein